MGKMFKIVTAAMLVLLALPLAAACTVQPEPDYAGAIAEDMLVAMSQGDFSIYESHLTAEAKAALTEADFKQASDFIVGRIGSYQSKTYIKTQDQSPYTTVYYKAKFSDEPADVIVRVVFQQVDGQAEVAGFWLDSPRLRANS